MDTQTNVKESVNAAKVIENWRTRDAMVGRKYPPDFLDDLALRANNVAISWLKAHNMPAEITDLLGSVFLLKENADKAGFGELDDNGAEWVVDLVPEVLHNISVLGGDFYNPDDETGYSLTPNLPAGWHQNREAVATAGKTV